MTSDELFKVQLAEAKDHLMHIDVSIKTTRSQIFVLIGICFGLLGFLCVDLMKLDFSSVRSLMCYPTVITTFFVLFKCRGSIIPPKQRMNGIMPKLFQTVVLKDQNPEDSILNTYQISIESNAKILKSLAKDYNTAFSSLIILGILLPLLCIAGAVLSQCFVGSAGV